MQKHVSVVLTFHTESRKLVQSAFSKHGRELTMLSWKMAKLKNLPARQSVRLPMDLGPSTETKEFSRLCFSYRFLLTSPPSSMYQFMTKKKSQLTAFDPMWSINGGFQFYVGRIVITVPEWKLLTASFGNVLVSSFFLFWLLRTVPNGFKRIIENRCFG